MTRSLIISFIFLSCTLTSQDVTLVNKKTNSYVSVYEGKKKTSIHLVSKTSSYVETWTKISPESRKIFIDSLYKTGWTKWRGTKDITKYFQIKLILDSVQKVTRLSDSTHKFYFHIDINDKKGNIYSAKGYNWTTQIETVAKAIKNQEIGFSISSIKKTNIFKLQLVSFAIFNSDRSPGSYQNGPYSDFYF
jgi:hypothetical protein